MKPTFAIAALLALSQSAMSQGSPPLEIKDIRIGESTLSEARIKFPGDKQTEEVIFSPQTFAIIQCGGRGTDCRSKTEDPFRLAGVLPTIYIFHAVEGMIEGIYVAFSKSGFLAIRDALVVKYGEPTETKTEEWKSRAGASFQGQVLTWARSGGEIRVTELGGRIDESRLTMQSPKYKAWVVETAKKKAQAGAKNL